MTTLAAVPHAPDILFDDAAPALGPETLGAICVYFEPSCTVVRLFGRIDSSMRREVLEAASDVADRGGPVTIDVAEGADVDAATLRLLAVVAGPEQRRPGPEPRRRGGRTTGPARTARTDVDVQPVRQIEN